MATTYRTPAVTANLKAPGDGHPQKKRGVAGKSDA
jgi:hypothetical protein